MKLKSRGMVMISRRAALIGIPAACIVSRIGWAKADPQSTIFANEIWHRPDIKPFGDSLRSVVCQILAINWVHSQYVGSHRTLTTQYIDLQKRYTGMVAMPLELALKLAGKPDEVETWIMATEIEHAMMRNGSLIKLVALDGRLSIDKATSQAVLQFYIEKNA